MTKQVTFKNDLVQKHRPLADAIKANLEVTGSVFKEKTQHEVYNANLPEGFTPAMIKSLSTYNGDYANAARVAAAETAAEVFLANPEINKVEGSIGYFAEGDSINLTIDRSKEYRAGIAKEGEEVGTMTKHLVITDSLSVETSRYDKLKKAMSAEFRDTFSK